jgi:hypothetical protein
MSRICLHELALDPSRTEAKQKLLGRPLVDPFRDRAGIELGDEAYEL